MKRKEYTAQLATGETVRRFALKTAQAAARDMLSEWAKTQGLTGKWSVTDGGFERGPEGITHWWQVWHHESGAAQRMVVNRTA